MPDVEVGGRTLYDFIGNRKEPETVRDRYKEENF